MSRRALGTRAGVVAVVAVLLCCAAPASAARSRAATTLRPTRAPAALGRAPPSAARQQVGQTLTGSDNFSGAASHQRGWLRCNAGGTGCSVIAGQTSTTYTLVDADADRVIKFRVRGTSITGGVHEDDAVDWRDRRDLPCRTARRRRSRGRAPAASR